METLITHDLKTPEKISLSEESGILSLLNEDLDFVLDSYSLSGAENDSFRTPLLFCPQPATGAAKTNRTSSPGPASSSSYTYTWTQGLTIRNNVIVGGYYDANKLQSGGGGVDCNMCWAAAASNMIAWWQNRYKVNERIGTKVPTTAQGIYDQFRIYWKNNGGYQHLGVAWWLAGDSDYYRYDSFYQETARNAYVNQKTGGFYSSFYTAGSIAQLTRSVDLRSWSCTAQSVASELSGVINRGGVISIAITDSNNYKNRHALSLWGFRSNKDGSINALYVTDSNGGRNVTRIDTISVSYDETFCAYRLTSGKYKDWHMDEYDYLDPFTLYNYSCPGSIKASKQKQYVTFRWTNRSKGSGITHQLAYRIKGKGNYTYLTTSANSLKVKLAADGKYEWCVRTKVGSVFTSDWARSSFTFTGAPPKITFCKATRKKLSRRKTRLGLRWKSNEKATFTLYLNGRRVYKGKGRSGRRYFTVKNGLRKYTLVAKDKYGNKSYTKGSIYCGDWTRPKLSGLSPSTTAWGSGRSGFTLRWKCNEKATYQLTLNGQVIYTGKATSYAHSSALADGSYTYVLTATDKAGNKRSVSGSFTCDATAPAAPAFGSVSNQDTQGSSSSLTLSWGAAYDVSGVTYQVYYARDGRAANKHLGDYKTTSTNITLPSSGGNFRWWVRAVDGRGNTSGWTQGETVSFAPKDTTAPTITLSAPELTKASEGNTKVSFSWKSNETATYVLKLNGTTIYTGSSLSYTHNTTLQDGTYSYTLTATDTAGNTTTESSSFTCDATMPAKPSFATVTNQRVEDGKTLITLNWGSVSDPSGVTYRVDYIFDGWEEDAVLGHTKDTSMDVTLTGEGEFTWWVCAIDGKNNYSYWTRGETVTFSPKDTTPPVITLNEPELSPFSTGKSEVDFSWQSNESATYVLKLDGVTIYTGSDTSYSHTGMLSDGTYTYTLTATDAAGNTTTESASFTCDATAPATPANLTVTNVCRNEEGKVEATLSWGSVYDVSGVTYQVDYSFSSWTEDERLGEYTKTSTGVTITGGGTFYWWVRAVDGKGNASSWKLGQSINLDAVPSSSSLSTPALAPLPVSGAAASTAVTPATAIDRELALSAGDLTCAGESPLCCTDASNSACSSLLYSTATLLKQQQGVLAAAV